MKKDKNKNSDGIVYSTNPDFVFSNSEETIITLAPEKQNLRVKTDKNGRKGKTVTLITGFVGANTDLEALGKKIKTFCGSGGSVKDTQIIIQGDFKEKITTFLIKEGYIKTKKE